MIIALAGKQNYRDQFTQENCSPKPLVKPLFLKLRTEAEEIKLSS